MGWRQAMQGRGEKGHLEQDGRVEVTTEQQGGVQAQGSRPEPLH